LSEFIGLGLKNNYSLQIARNNQEISDNNFTKGNAGFLPVLDLSARQIGTINNTHQTPKEGETISSSGIHNTTTNAGLNLGWNLFNGFLVQTTYKKLEELKQQGEIRTRLEIERFVALTGSEYYNFVQNTRQLQYLKYAVSLSKERFRIDEERYLIGSGSRLQMLQSKVFLNADSSRLSHQYELVRASLIRLNEMAGAENFEVLPEAEDTLIIVNEDLSYEELLASTLQNNTNLLLSSNNTRISEYDREIILSRNYPYLMFNSGYGYNFNTYQAGIYINQGTLGFNYGVTVGINLFDGFNRRRELSNAVIEINNTKLSYEQILQEVKADLMTIYKAYENNLRLLKLEYENLETARENMDIAFERYRLGDLAGIELREVQKSLLEAEESLLSLQFQTKLAEISLMQISGRITDYF
jgi:outer membrane protein TolC